MLLHHGMKRGSSPHVGISLTSKSMKLFNYEIKRITPDSEIKNAILNKAEQNAKAGLVTAHLELRHHQYLLEQLEYKLPPTEEEKEALERETRLTKEAIERDERSINNWLTQLKAINHERD